MPHPAPLPAPPRSAPPRTPPAQVRVGGNINPPVKVRDVRPVYPSLAQSARVQGVVILEATDDPNRGVIGIELHADGRHGSKLWVEVPASRYQPRLTAEHMAEGRHFPRMDGPFVFKHAIVKMPEVVGSVLAKAGVKAEQLKLFIPHQANLRISEVVQKSLGLKDEQVFNNIQRYGNTTAASIPIALTEGLAARDVKQGDLVALGAFGAGFTWAAALMRW